MSGLIAEWEREKRLRATLPAWVAEAVLGPPSEAPKPRSEPLQRPPAPTTQPPLPPKPKEVPA